VLLNAAGRGDFGRVFTTLGHLPAPADDSPTTDARDHEFHNYAQPLASPALPPRFEAGPLDFTGTDCEEARNAATGVAAAFHEFQRGLDAGGGRSGPSAVSARISRARSRSLPDDH